MITFKPRQGWVTVLKNGNPIGEIIPSACISGGWYYCPFKTGESIGPVMRSPQEVQQSLKGL